MKETLINIRDRFQTLLDNHQLQGTGLDSFKMIMVEFSALIAATTGEPDNGQASEKPAAPIPAGIDAELIDEVIGEIQDMAGVIADSYTLNSYFLAKLLEIERQKQATANTAPAPAAPVAPAAQPAAPAAQPAA